MCEYCDAIKMDWGEALRLKSAYASMDIAAAVPDNDAANAFSAIFYGNRQMVNFALNLVRENKQKWVENITAGDMLHGLEYLTACAGSRSERLDG